MAEDREQRAIVSTWVPVSTVRALRARAAEQDRSLSAEVRRAVNAHLAGPSRGWTYEADSGEKR